jgi:hypothetical protein
MKGQEVKERTTNERTLERTRSEVHIVVRDKKDKLEVEKTTSNKTKKKGELKCKEMLIIKDKERKNNACTRKSLHLGEVSMLGK